LGQRRLIAAATLLVCVRVLGARAFFVSFVFFFQLFVLFMLFVVLCWLSTST